MEEHGKGGGRDRKEDVEEKEGRRWLFTVVVSGGCKEHTLPIFLHKHTFHFYTHATRYSSYI